MIRIKEKRKSEGGEQAAGAELLLWSQGVGAETARIPLCTLQAHSGIEHL